MPAPKQSKDGRKQLNYNQSDESKSNHTKLIFIKDSKDFSMMIFEIHTV
jgi:hypothetical protein